MRRRFVLLSLVGVGCGSGVAVADHDGIAWRKESDGSWTFFVGNTNPGALNSGPIGGLTIEYMDGGSPVITTFTFTDVFPNPAPPAFTLPLPADVSGAQHCLVSPGGLPYADSSLRWQEVRIGDDPGEPMLAGLISVTPTNSGGLADSAGACFPLDIDLDDCDRGVTNGSFEGDFSGWTLTDAEANPEDAVAFTAMAITLEDQDEVTDATDGVMAELSLAVPLMVTPTDGDRAAVFLRNAPGAFLVTQTITVPLDATTLRWSMQYDNQYGMVVSGDQGLGIIADYGGPDQRVLFSIDASEPQTAAMSAYDASLTDFAGQTIDIAFIVNAILGPYDVVVDDFHFRRCAALPNSAPTCSGGETPFTVVTGESTQFFISGADSDGDPLTLTYDTLPPDVSVSPTGEGTDSVSVFIDWIASAANLGVSMIDFTFTDPSGASATCTLDVYVHEAPVAICSAAPSDGMGDVGMNVVYECTDPGGRMVDLDGGMSYDPEGTDLEYHWDVSDADVILDDPDSPMPSGLFPVGSVVMVTLTVTDEDGGTDTCDVTVQVVDSESPVAACTTDVAALFPANHQMRTVTVYVSAVDECDPSPDFTVTVRSDEPDDAHGFGDGRTTGDVDGEDGYTSPVDITDHFAWDPTDEVWVGTVDLRAERGRGHDGRTYTFDVTATDETGNTGEASCVVVVPHRPQRFWWIWRWWHGCW